MEDRDRTKEQLMDELVELRQRVAALEAAVAERQRAEEALRRHQDELAARSNILSATLRTTDLDELLGLILDEVVALLGMEFGAIHLVQADQVVLRAWRGLSAAFRAQVLAFPADDAPDWVRESRVVHEHLDEEGLTPGFAKGEGVQAWASVPLRLPHKDGGGGGWLGTLMVGSRRYEALSEDDVGALWAMAEQLALAIDHTRTYREARERLARLHTLREVDKGIIQRLDLRDILHVVLERVPKELGADAVAISLLDEEQVHTQVFVMHLPNGTVVEEEAFELAGSLLHWLVERQEPVIIYDLTQDPRVQVHRERIRNSRLISYLGVPLVVHDRTIGILHIMATQPRVFADEDVVFFRTMAGQAAIAIENARLYKAVKQELAERIEAERALRASEERYRSLFEGVPVGLYRTTPDGRFLDVNQALVEMSGYPDRESLLATNVVEGYVNPEDHQRWQELVERNEVVRDFVHQARRPDGTTYWVKDSARVVRDAEGKVLYYEGSLEDITERVRAEEELRQSREQLRRLADYLQTARERERARIAREIHDEFAQALTALKMDLSWLVKRLPDELPALREKADSMSELIDRTVETTRRVITELRPGLLDSLGLTAAIEWQAEEFAQRTGIECQLHGVGRDIVLHPDLATAIFRIFQEALTNVTRHAEATRVVVWLEASPDEVMLVVRDDGKGIAEGQVSDSGSLGLAGMRERAASWGGTVTFEGVPGQGTTVTVRMPRVGVEND